MFKKVILTLSIALAAGSLAKAQTNLQIFYDLAKDRGHFTTTLEGFYNDPWGNTFFFIDYDFNDKDTQNRQIGASGSSSSSMITTPPASCPASNPTPSSRCSAR